MEDMVNYLTTILEIADRQFNLIEASNNKVKFHTGGKKSRLTYTLNTKLNHIICTDIYDREINEKIMDDLTYESISEFIVSSEIKAILN
jgi:hypothetical protein